MSKMGNTEDTTSAVEAIASGMLRVALHAFAILGGLMLLIAVMSLGALGTAVVLGDDFAHVLAISFTSTIVLFVSCVLGAGILHLGDRLNARDRLPKLPRAIWRRR